MARRRRLFGVAAEARGFESAFDSASGERAVLVLDYAGVVGGQFYDGVSNTLAFDDIHTFTRASLATQRDTAGLVKFVPHNLVLRTETLDNAYWIEGNAAITANATTAPDGASTADELVEDSSSSAKHSISANSITFVLSNSVSFYCKKNTRSWVILGVSGGGDFTSSQPHAWFNLDAGTLGTVASNNSTTATITSVGDGWFLCTVSFVFTSAARKFYIAITTDNNISTHNGNGTSSIYAWGAAAFRTPMAAANDTYADAYVPITDAIIYQHRLDHDKDGNRTGLQEEEERENLALQSNVFTTTWSIPSTTLTPTKVTTGPDGLTSGWKLQDDNGGGEGAVQVSQNLTVVISTVYTFSVFAKLDVANIAWVAIKTTGFTTPGDVQSFFDLTNGVVGSAGSGHTLVISDEGNGWYRCSITFTTDGTDTTGSIQVRVSEGDGDVTVALDNTSSIFIYGAQFEKGNVVSSYIPTATVAVTRAAEVCSVAVADFAWGGNVGAASAKAGGDAAVMDDDNASILTTEMLTGNILIRKTTVDNVARTAAGILKNSFASASTFIAAQLQVAAAWDATNVKIALDGSAILTGTGTQNLGSDTTLYIGTQKGENNWWNSHINYIAVYAPATIMSDADVVGLATP